MDKHGLFITTGIITWIIISTAIPILCTLSFVYNWYSGLKFILTLVEIGNIIFIAHAITITE